MRGGPKQEKLAGEKRRRSPDYELERNSHVASKPTMSAGHPSEDDIPNVMRLRVAGVPKIAFAASGGMMDGRGLVTLAVGAKGINMGTQFIATREAPAHDNAKRALVDADELQRD